MHASCHYLYTCAPPVAGLHVAHAPDAVKLPPQRLCLLVRKIEATQTSAGQHTKSSQPPQQPRRSRLLSKHRRPQRQQQPVRPDSEDVSVPEVGWLWNVGSTRSTAASQVSALATVKDLRRDRISAKRSLGQNFLTDDFILRDIVSAAGVKAGDLVLEVGPGTGNLTKHLLAAGAFVTAIEKDDNLFARLSETYAQEPKLTLVHGDVLKLNMGDIVNGMWDKTTGRHLPGAATSPSSSPVDDTNMSDTQRASDRVELQPSLTTPDETQLAADHMNAEPRKKRRIKVVANLPYNITTDFLKAALPAGDVFSDLHIMLQEEAGVRLVHSKPGDKDYRAMSLRVALYSKPQYRFKICKTKYYPQPGVDGALLSFRLLPPAVRPALRSEQSFLRTVDKAFSERRKMMKNSLQPLYGAEQIEASLRAAEVASNARAQDLDLKQWVSVYSHLQKHVIKEYLSHDNTNEGESPDMLTPASQAM